MIDTVERLLYEGEGDALDFKSSQYPFAGATDDQKSELLKDILAMANSWRRTMGYVLVGVQEVKGPKAVVVGIVDPLDDANLQQFVNSKTNRPVAFSYQNVALEGRNIALISVPVQERPRYLLKDYGALKKNVVYVRRGSSTAEASPDEIAQMGVSTIERQQSPVLEAFFADVENRIKLTEAPKLNSLVLDMPPRKSIPDFDPDRGPYASVLGGPRREYYRELSDFLKKTRFFRPLHLGISNSGGVTALDVRVRIRIPGQDSGLAVIDAWSYPSLPAKYSDPIAGLRPVNPFATTRQLDITVSEVGPDWLVEARVEKVQPQDVEWVSDPFYVGAHKSGAYTLEGTIFADNLAQPQKQHLPLIVESASEKVELNKLYGFTLK